jgi:hypothetical protein
MRREKRAIDMSAYVVEDEVINGVIAFLAVGRDIEHIQGLVRDETGIDLAAFEGKQKLGEAMFALNCNAVEQRYGQGEAKEFRDLDYQFCTQIPPTVLQAYKSLGCWLYQCSEGDVPGTSLLFATMQRVHDNMAHFIVGRLDAYGKAKW